MATKDDCESIFTCRNILKNRKTIYVTKELQDKLAEIFMSMRSRDMTIDIYVGTSSFIILKSTKIKSTD